MSFGQEAGDQNMKARQIFTAILKINRVSADAIG
jgi:hypothetical protein